MTPWKLAKGNSESAHQKALFCWAACAANYGFAIADDPLSYEVPGYAMAELRKCLSNPAVDDLSKLFAIPNGGKRDPVTAARMKAEGVRAGIPDVFLPVGRGGYFGCWIEMKIGKGTPSPEQKARIKELAADGYQWFVAYSWLEARTFIKNYLSLPPTRLVSA